MQHRHSDLVAGRPPLMVSGQEALYGPDVASHVDEHTDVRVHLLHRRSSFVNPVDGNRQGTLREDGVRDEVGATEPAHPMEETNNCMSVSSRPMVRHVRIAFVMFPASDCGTCPC